MGKKASKKKSNRKFEIVLQIAEWNRGFTGVKKYVPQSVFVWAKTREKAIKKFDELHGISVLLCVKG